MSSLFDLPAVYRQAEKLYKGFADERSAKADDPGFERGEAFDAAFGDAGEVLGDSAAFGDAESGCNYLICAENSLCLKALNQKASFDFVYIDPPFYSGADYLARVGENKEKQKVYTDKWESLDEYLTTLLVRLFLIKDVLKDSGTVAVHLDTHAAHYVKVLMDEMFGPENFVNDIIWSYKSGGARKKGFARKHDSILVYSKTPDYFFNPQKERSYNRGGKPYRFKGVEEYRDEEGRWYTLVNRKDVISVDMVGRTALERTGYATQKPERLLNILIESFCPAGGLCGDFYCGSGSLGAAAGKSGRSFIMSDISPVAIDMAAKRLEKDEISFRVCESFSIRL